MKKEKTIVLKLLIILVSMSILILLLGLGIKTSLKGSSLGGSLKEKQLTYVIYKPRGEINLDLFEAERYEAAVVVQPLIGNLVYFSNHGRYEPRLASKWERIAPNVWSFELKDGFTCENGEKITADTFKKSLERSILAVSKKGDPPIFSRLQGYQTFLERKIHLSGITASHNRIIFTFDRPIRSGVVEVLSFAPFGYICKDNLNDDGSWKDKSKFISSGSYQLNYVSLGKEYILKRRSEWDSISDVDSPSVVKIVHEIPSNVDENENVIVDSLAPVDELPTFLRKYNLVPEYLNAVLLGNLNDGFFSNKKNREVFKKNLEAVRDEWPSSFGIHFRANSFYANKSKDDLKKIIDYGNIVVPAKALVIEGVEPVEGTFKFESWLILKKTLEQLRLKYEFAGNNPVWSEIRSGKFDLRMRGTSVGGGVEAWGLDVLFCSLIGPNYPDPSGRVCNLIEKYENSEINESELSNLFDSIIEDDAAIVPVSHFGIQLFLSRSIVRESLNPTLNVMRFDQLEIE